MIPYDQSIWIHPGDVIYCTLEGYALVIKTYQTSPYSNQFGVVLLTQNGSVCRRGINFDKALSDYNILKF
jgi:hypothetical protein